MMRFHNPDGSLNGEIFPKTKMDRYAFACEELDLMLDKGSITRSEYYWECRQLERDFFGDDYVD